MSDVPQHSSAFKNRRLLNWIPLGLTYATFYMGRYNFNVAKGVIGADYHLDNAQLGIVGTAGFWTYALSVMLNGPLADRFGGKRAILFGAVGASLFNILIGLLFFGGFTSNLVISLSVLYAANSYFQSFGALSVVKVNAPWFHLRERGVFSGLFGMMISMGYLLALSVGEKVLKYFGLVGVFVAPSLFMGAMFLVVLVWVRERPSETGHPDFETGEAASTDDGGPVRVLDVVRRVLSHRVIRTMVLAEFCTGFVRQGLLFNYIDFLVKVHHLERGSNLLATAGVGVTVGGIVGSVLCGVLSDYVFQSRRPPVAFIYYVLQIPSLLLLGYTSSPAVAAVMVGFSCAWIFGVHGMLSGAASVDFGGKRAAATATGLLDGIAYVASGFAVFGLGKVIDRYGWGMWIWCIVPFSVIGAILMGRLWNVRAGQGQEPTAH